MPQAQDREKGICSERKPGWFLFLRFQAAARRFSWGLYHENDDEYVIFIFHRYFTWEGGERVVKLKEGRA